MQIIQSKQIKSPDFIQSEQLKSPISGYMDSHVNTTDFACEDYSSDGLRPQRLCTGQKQAIVPPSVSVLCSTCAQPRWESEWNFSIEDGVPINNRNSSFKRGDSVKEKSGKGQKMRRNMGRVFYHRQPRVSVLCSTCAQPRLESEWNFNIEDGVTINNSNEKLCKTGDRMKDKEKTGKIQKMGRVLYNRPPRAP